MRKEDILLGYIKGGNKNINIQKNYIVLRQILISKYIGGYRYGKIKYLWNRVSIEEINHEVFRPLCIPTVAIRTWAMDWTGFCISYKN